MDDQRAVVPLIGAMKDNDSAVRSKAAFDLGNLGDIHAEDPLILALKDEDEVVRANAALALGVIGDNRIVKPLISVLKDEENSSVQSRTAYVIEEINGTTGE